jgi:hypothetical protein
VQQFLAAPKGLNEVSEKGEVIIDVYELFKEAGTAKLADLPKYEEAAIKIAGEGNVVKLTGQGPIWLYLRLAHVLHGRAKKLLYSSPVVEDLVIFDHDPN